MILSSVIEPDTKQAIDQFPVTVHPRNKTIIETPEAEAYFERKLPQLMASTEKSRIIFWTVITQSVNRIVDSSIYQNLAAVGGSQLNNKFVAINPGFRKEQVATAFARALDWTDAEKKEFLTHSPSKEGSFFPSQYVVAADATPKDVRALVQERFSREVLANYGTSTSLIVPIDQALNIASMIERETIGNRDMRLVSGIIWNRIFSNMKLQLDATLQYAEASTRASSEWWPTVEPEDKRIRSPYNTYLHTGLPPTPISNPSVAAILAALNPLETDCIFYFHDRKGDIHCSVTYGQHVKLIKQYYK